MTTTTALLERTDLRPDLRPDLAPMRPPPVLAWCNAQRAARGMEPLERLPKGICMDGWRCVISKALGEGVWVNDVRFGYTPDLASSRELPELVRYWVNRFDAGDFPELIEDAS